MFAEREAESPPCFEEIRRGFEELSRQAPMENIEVEVCISRGFFVDLGCFHSNLTVSFVGK